MKKQAMKELNISRDEREEICTHLIGKLLAKFAHVKNRIIFNTLKAVIEENREWWFFESHNDCSEVMYHTFLRLFNRDGFGYELKTIHDSYEEDMKTLREEASNLSMEVFDGMNKITPKAISENVCEHLLAQLLAKLIHDNKKAYDYEAVLNAINLSKALCDYDRDNVEKNRSHIFRTTFAKMKANPVTAQALREVYEDFISK